MPVVRGRAPVTSDVMLGVVSVEKHFLRQHPYAFSDELFQVRRVVPLDVVRAETVAVRKRMYFGSAANGRKGRNIGGENKRQRLMQNDV